MILLAGPKYMPQAYGNTPLARLLPLDVRGLLVPDPDKPLTEGFVVQPTELGLASPAMQLGDTPEETRAIWRNLPPLYWLVEASAWKPGVRVLAEHPTRVGRDGRRLPVIAMQYVGAGKVLFHATDETWRWRRRDGNVYFARYWIQTIRYLSRGKLADGQHSAELTTDRSDYHPGDPVRLRVRFADEALAPADDNGVVVIVEQRGHKKQSVQLHRAASGRGAFEGVLSTTPMGKYRAWIAAPTLPGSGAGRFHRGAPARRIRPRLDGCGRDARGRPDNERRLHHLRRRRSPPRQAAQGGAGAFRNAAVHAVVELEAGAPVVPGAAHR